MKIEKSLFSSGVYFSQLDSVWFAKIQSFLSGESKELLETLVLALAEKSGARANRKKLQDDIDALSKFWRLEVQVLVKLCKKAKFLEYPVPQLERDALRIFARQLEL